MFYVVYKDEGHVLGSGRAVPEAALHQLLIFKDMAQFDHWRKSLAFDNLSRGSKQPRLGPFYADSEHCYKMSDPVVDMTKWTEEE